jgi:DNA-binding NtrC family response regulator
MCYDSSLCKMQDLENPIRSNGSQLVVLLAEDESLMLTVLRKTLKHEGYLVLTASDGEEALLVSHIFRGTIHALLTDIRMPKMNGLELQARIQAERPGIKVLLMSGYAFEGGQTPFLRKPFTSTVLRERMRELLAPVSQESNTTFPAPAVPPHNQPIDFRQRFRS